MEVRVGGRGRTVLEATDIKVESQHQAPTHPEITERGDGTLEFDQIVGCELFTSDRVFAVLCDIGLDQPFLEHGARLR